jgi:hypothetical protein
VFSSDRAGGGRSDLYTVPISGGTPTLLTDTPTLDEKEPVWSPDGRKIAFAGQAIAGAPFDVYSINADGSDLRQLTVAPGDDHQPSWQPIPQGYARPRGATPLRVPLVPAFNRCTSPNNTHGAPLNFPSCSPATQTSPNVTVGAPDANGSAANSSGFVRLDAVTGDVRLSASVTDVRCYYPSAPAFCADQNLQLDNDYAGELQGKLQLRITDRNNTPSPGGAGPGTVQDTPLLFTVPCTTTGPSNFIGSSCAVSTTVNTLIPGAVTAGLRTIWALGQIVVYDGGADGLASTTGDNTLFMDQGTFIP